MNKFRLPTALLLVAPASKQQREPVFPVLGPSAWALNMWLEPLTPQGDLCACVIPLLNCVPSQGDA